MAKTVNFIVLFNGTSNSDLDKNVTNIVKIHQGLIKDDSQMVIYLDGIGNPEDWTSIPSRYFSQATGYGGGWIMQNAYKQIETQIKAAIAAGQLSPGDTVSFSVGGFSRGAAMCRHFVNQYLVEQFPKDINGWFTAADPKKYPSSTPEESWWKTATGWIFGTTAPSTPKIKTEIAAEYLFESVASFGIPINIWVLSQLGIHDQQIDPGWNFTIPEQVKNVYHALSCDEKLDGYAPKLIDHPNREDLQHRLETWFCGGHSDTGGGNTPLTPDCPMEDAQTLRWMVRHALANGLKFDDAFIAQHNILSNNQLPLGQIDDKDWTLLPSTQHGPRDIRVLINGKTSSEPVIFHESVFRRLKEDKTYQPAWLTNISRCQIEFENGQRQILSDKDLSFIKSFVSDKIGDTSNIKTRLKTQRIHRFESLLAPTPTLEFTKKRILSTQDKNETSINNNNNNNEHNHRVKKLKRGVTNQQATF